jgi:hypothetical protein
MRLGCEKLARFLNCFAQELFPSGVLFFVHCVFSLPPFKRGFRLKKEAMPFVSGPQRPGVRAVKGAFAFIGAKKRLPRRSKPAGPKSAR